MYIYANSTLYVSMVRHLSVVSLVYFSTSLPYVGRYAVATVCPAVMSCCDWLTGYKSLVMLAVTKEGIFYPV